MLCRLQSRILIFKSDIKSLRRQSKLSYLHNVGSEPLRPLTLGRLLESTIEKYGANYAVISKHQNKKLTYSEAFDEANRLAAGLSALGLKNGDRVGLWAQNIIEWYVAFLACARAGYLMVAINPAYQPRELEYCINKVGIKSIICGHKFRKQDYYEVLTHVCPELSYSEPGKLKSRQLPTLQSVVTICDETLRGTYNYKEVLELATEDSINFIKKNQDRIKIDDPINIQLTSGTTGHPKAAAVSHFGLVNNGYYIGKRNELDTKHHTICVLVPLFHGFGTVITISASVNHGATLVLPSDGFDPNKSLDAIKEENCTIIHGTPTMYVDLVRVQKERREKISPEIAVTGGAPCSPSLFKDMLNVIGLKKVKSVYGLSEVTAIVFQSMVDDDEYRSTATVGHIHDHIEAKVVDADDNIVPMGTPGELCIRAYGNMLGYWGDDNKTKEIMGQDRWLHTGDQFIMSEDGYGKVVGRLKEMIIRGGENIFPKEIEDYLNTHPHILESYVIGLPHERLGEEVCACIRVQEGHSLTLEEMKAFCKGNISHFKIPSVLVIVEEIPKTLSGKVQKFKLLEHVVNNKSNK
ncbi:acyl-CoA synthetase family member 2, mitochondrial-like [Anoplophora glabripennis]|uniref:acyl-CoA synthetase family member 2, mitochondrial-like n=1 Tax=Anoplophora glabripennis TaxID=217634 RepID=UPI0008758777|nr:acyl-CoA synthetase family member 2, mitochondrial-like [Anoplophora glabripennis]